MLTADAASNSVPDIIISEFQTEHYNFVLEIFSILFVRDSGNGELCAILATPTLIKKDNKFSS
jgi:hypothetical protein